MRCSLMKKTLIFLYEFQYQHNFNFKNYGIKFIDVYESRFHKFRKLNYKNKKKYLITLNNPYSSTAIFFIENMNKWY